MLKRVTIAFGLAVLAVGCTPSVKSPAGASLPSSGAPVAVVGVDASKSGADWVLSVSILSTETGCDQYADWWEVVGPDGALLYRRVLGHSHPNEQPFTRSGTSFAVADDVQVTVRAHMNPDGYGLAVYQGTIDNLQPVTLDAEWGSQWDTPEGPWTVENVQPLPDGCLF